MRTSPLFGTLDLALPEIEKLGKLRAPVEACGILLDRPWWRGREMSFIKELPNRALEPASYRIDMADVMLALEGLDDVEEIAVWHTHPSGLIGPSRLDMVRRPPPDIFMIVVALTEDGPIPAWF